MISAYALARTQASKEHSYGIRGADRAGLTARPRLDRQQVLDDRDVARSTSPDSRIVICRVVWIDFRTRRQKP